MNITQKRIYKDKLEYCKREMKKLVEVRELARSIPLPELPDDIWSNYSDSDFTINVGFSPENVHLIFERMIKDGWSSTSKPEKVIASLKSGKTSYEFVSWWNDDFPKPFYIFFVVGGTGSNCKRIKIGTEKVETPVYEVICNDAIAEMEV